jgi:hypothetical protein
VSTDATAAIAAFWTIPFTVRRYLGDGPTGPIHTQPATETGRVRHVRKLLRTTDQVEVVSTSTVSMALDVDPIPVGSLVRIDGEAEERTVVGEGRHVGIPGVTPDYYSIDLA